MTKQSDNELRPGRGGPVSVSDEMIDAGVAALYGEMGYQMEGDVRSGVAAVIQTILSSD